ncbi:MAG: VWA domain-containing protein [Acidobacteriota bacterium]|nr:VWA domain-containing protein [Acidobacteriota bacterium]
MAHGPAGRSLLGRALLVIAAVACVAAGPRQTFKTATRLVELSVVVTDRNGRPVEGLTQADFTIRDEREPQKISFFDVRDDRAPSKAIGPGIFRASTAANEFTNAVADGTGTTTVLVLDRANAGFATLRWAKQAIDNYQLRLRPGDRTALYAFDSGVRVLHDFTADTASLRRALDLFQAKTTGQYDASQAPPNDTGGMAVWLVDPGNAVADYYGERRAADSFKRLELIAEHLAGISGRKNLVWVSEAFAIPTGLGRMEVFYRMHRATEALSNAQTSVYPVDARGLIGSHTVNLSSGQAAFTTMGSSHPNIETMRVVSDDTGGRTFAHTNALDTSIAKAVDDSRLTYVLGYYPSSSVLDGSFRQVDVKVRRAGVQVRHRAGYLAAAPPTDARGREAAIRKALEAPLQATGIGLAATVTSVNGNEAVDLAIRVELNALTLERDGSAWRGLADLLIAQVDRTGKGEVSDAGPISIGLSEDERSRAVVDGVRIHRRIKLDPAVHELRIVVRDPATGQVGSLVIPKRALVSQ